MSNYKNEIIKLGLAPEKLPNSIAEMITDYEEAEIEYNELQEKLENTEDEEDREGIEKEIVEYENLLREEDENIIAKLNKYAARKPFYDERGRQLANMNKKGQSASVENQIDEGQQVVSSQTSEPIIEEKKKSKGDWILWGGLGLLGLIVGVNVFKNRA